MPRILSRHELFARNKLIRPWSHNQSSSTTSNGSWSSTSPTIGRQIVEKSSFVADRNEKSSYRHEGLSYRIADDATAGCVPSSENDPVAAADDDWGHYVDFQDPPSVVLGCTSFLQFGNLLPLPEKDEPFPVFKTSTLQWALNQKERD
jgi:hypothetical protein